MRPVADLATGSLAFPHQISPRRDFPYVMFSLCIQKAQTKCLDIRQQPMHRTQPFIQASHLQPAAEHCPVVFLSHACSKGFQRENQVYWPPSLVFAGIRPPLLFLCPCRQVCTSAAQGPQSRVLMLQHPQGQRESKTLYLRDTGDRVLPLLQHNPSSPFL